MYLSEEERAAIQAADSLMRDTMARYDPSHDAYHVLRVRRTALAIANAIIAAGVKVDLLVVEISALLHDVLDKKYVSAEDAADPYSYFLPFFKSLPVNLVSDGRGEKIAKIIDNVSWSTEKKLRERGEWGPWHELCVELHCVQDADRLDAIGAFGIMRVSAYTVVINRPLHVPQGSEGGTSAIDHFHEKLLLVKDRLKTEPGRKMGEVRHQRMLDFLSSIAEEYNAKP